MKQVTEEQAHGNEHSLDSRARLPGRPLVKQRFNHAAYFNKVSISATASFVDSMRRGRGPHLKPREVDDLRPDAAPQRARCSLWRALERPKHTVLNLTAPSHFFFNSNSVPYPGSLRRLMTQTLETGSQTHAQAVQRPLGGRPTAFFWNWLWRSQELVRKGSETSLKPKTNRLFTQNRFAGLSEGQ